MRGACSPQCRAASALGNGRPSKKPDAGGVVSVTFSPAPQRGARLRLSPTLNTHIHTYIDKRRRAQIVASLGRRQGKARIPTAELRRVSRRGRTQLPAFSCSAPGAELCAPRWPLPHRESPLTGLVDSGKASLLPRGVCLCLCVCVLSLASRLLRFASCPPDDYLPELCLNLVPLRSPF